MMVIKREHHCHSTPFSKTVFPFPEFPQLTLEITASYQTTSQGAPSEDDPTNTTVSTFRRLICCVLSPSSDKKKLTCMNALAFSALQIFVGNLDSNVNDELLKQVFGQYGQLLHVKIPVGKRCGFVQFADR